MKYYTRIAEEEIKHKLQASGALLIKGPKSCGKTEAANNLLKFNAQIDEKKYTKPVSLNIITGTGMSFTRPDGINVISLASLGK